MDPPDDLVGALAYVSFHDFHRAVHGTGAFALNDIAAWYDSLANQERFGTLKSLVHQAQMTKRLKSALGALPVADIAERYLGIGGRSSTWFREWAVRGDADDPFWMHRDLTPALDRVAVPVKLVAGWQDIFLNQTFEEYRAPARPRRRCQPDGRPVDARQPADQGRVDSAVRVPRVARRPRRAG